MNIEKLKSGSYRIRMMENGRRYSITVPYRPKNDREAYDLIRKKIDNPNSEYDILTFNEAANKYIDSKSNVLSPSTVRGYKEILKKLPEDFLSTEIKNVTPLLVQTLINDLALSRTPKSVRNVHGFISAVLKVFNPSVILHTTLPQKVRKNVYIPTREDVTRLLEYCEPTEYFVPLYLATLGLRRSEICALDITDVNGNIITINKALVQDQDLNFVVKPCPKTDYSNRTVVIPQILADRIHEQGYIYRGHPNSINKYLHKALVKLEIPEFSLHKLRHFFASYTHDQGFSDAVIQSLGGWNSDVMKQVYRHAMKVDEAKINVANEMVFVANSVGNSGQ